MSHSNALVVDSSFSTRNYVREILRNELSFHEIHESEDANDALRILKSRRDINWIFSSWEMTGLSTHDFLETVRHSPDGAHTHFVLMSANEEHVVRNIAIRRRRRLPVQALSPHQMVHMVRRLTGLVKSVALSASGLLALRNRHGFRFVSPLCAELADISTTGCRVRTSQVKPGSGYIDDYATITLLPEAGAPLHVQAKIKRLEFDKDCTDPLRDTQDSRRIHQCCPGTPGKNSMSSSIQQGAIRHKWNEYMETE